MDLLSSTCHAVWTSEGGSTAARPCTEPQSQDPPWGHTGRKSRPHLAHPFFLLSFFIFIFLSCSPWSTDTECRACCRPTQCHRFSTRRSNNLPTTARGLNLPRQSWACKVRLGRLGERQQMDVIWLAVTVNVGDCRSWTWRCASGKQHHQACYLGPWDLVLRSPGKKAFKQTWTFGTAWTMTFWTIVDIF